MTKLRVILAAIFFVLTAMASRGNVQDSDNDKKIAAEASAAYDAKNWIKSAALYEKLTQAHPETPRLWFRVGLRQLFIEGSRLDPVFRVVSCACFRSYFLVVVRILNVAP